MIHYLSVHWKSPRWIETQVQSFARHSSEPHRAYAFLNGIDGSYAKYFHYASLEDIEWHRVKLNLLADIASAGATSDDDILAFIDGDAYMIGDWVGQARAKFEKHKLVAVQRLENENDQQPHPCFAATTVGFWRQIGGDWRRPTRLSPPTPRYPAYDGTLLKTLRDHKVDFAPLHRTNKVDLHQVWYGVYGDVVYHHGAAFRSRMNRSDLAEFAQTRPLAKGIWKFGERYTGKNHPMAIAARKAFDVVYGREYGAIIDAENKLSARVERACFEDPQFPTKFLDASLTPEALLRSLPAPPAKIPTV